MGSHDPRVIIVALEDLLQELRLWSARAGQTLAAAAQVQRQAREAAERAFHRASIIFDEAMQDEERVGKVRSAVAGLLSECHTGRDAATRTLDDAHQTLDAATSTLDFWEEELRKALAWLERARARLARAIAEYERARSAYERAQREMERAYSRYNSCLNDKNRSNCDREARDVRSAQEELQKAEYFLRLAQAEVIAAQEEVEAAEARVRCCSNAVEYATQAVTVASETVSLAEQAANSAERSLEFAQAAERGALVAKEKVEEEVAVAEQMLTNARAVVSATDQAAAHLSAADNAEESAQRHVIGAGHELEYRLQLLHQINRADLYASVAGAAAYGTSGAPGRVATWVDAGIQFVNVADLPDPDGISGGDDFRKTTEAEMRSGISKLQEMRPLIESGVGASSDYWADYDKSRGLDFAGGYQRVYDAFYGIDCVKVNKDQNSYDIDNGRHRIWLAKRMGVEQLPVRIVERRSEKT
jgi:exonuclease VII small subunit